MSNMPKFDNFQVSWSSWSSWSLWPVSTDGTDGTDGIDGTDSLTLLVKTLAEGSVCDSCDVLTYKSFRFVPLESYII